ncbi:MAG: alpha-L-fucosidase [Akkermansia sp.]
MNKSTILSLLTMSVLACAPSWSASAPAPYGPIPTPQQVDWQRMEYYGFVHFGLNTYTDREWGYGDEDPKLFNPSDFDANKIAKIFKDAGMKGLILTAKHHDGFCLWPTKTTEHNISKSPWKNGKGNLVFEFAKASHDNGIKFGTYISPWDRNNAEYAKPGYIKDYYAQITELLSGKYGQVFEIWFDGANGGDGYYGGAKEGRTIPKDYYRFDKIVKMIRKLQPNCIIWGAGHYGDARWGGSEQGHVGYPHWALLDEKNQNNEGIFGTGVSNGDRWVPAEGDVSIRNGWFWHKSANNSVKSPEKLLQIWLDSVGRGANLILNVPPDKEGHIYQADVDALMGFKALRDQLLANDFALGAKGIASNFRGKDKKFDPSNLFDNKIESYWTTDDGITTPSVEIKLAKPASFDMVRLREQIRLGQRVESFKVSAWDNGAWKQIIDGKTIGNQVILPTTTGKVTTDRLKLEITGSRAVPCISEFSLLLRPVSIAQPAIERAGDQVQIIANTTGTIRYTLDGTEPKATSPVYTAPIDLRNGGTIKSRVFDDAGHSGPIAAKTFGVSKNGWKIVSTTAEGSTPQNAIDDKPNTFWHTHQNKEQNPPQSFTVDMGSPVILSSFSYIPRQDGTTNGMTDRYIFEVSPDNKQWTKVAEGEFSNLRANPIEQTVSLQKTEKPVQYFRFTGTRAVDKNHVSAAEISVYSTQNK